MDSLRQVTDAERASAAFDTAVPAASRVCNALLGGKDNYASDRLLAARLVKVLPRAPLWAAANRAFVVRAVRYLAECGIDQFVDLGCGLPTAVNTHEVAQRVNPDAAVVYVDHDPVVVSHGLALLELGDRVRVVAGDLRDPRDVIGSAAELVDWSRPVGLVAASVLHLVGGEVDPYEVIDVLRDHVTGGSCLVVSHVQQRADVDAAAAIYRDRIGAGWPRSRSGIARFMAGWDLVDPGLVPLPLWRPDQPVPADPDMPWLAAVGRKP